LVFSFLKNDLRFHRNLRERFTMELLHSIIKINRAHLIRCYLHCLSDVSIFIYLFIYFHSFIHSFTSFHFFFFFHLVHSSFLFFFFI
jgi:hypothetical protein